MMVVAALYHGSTLAVEMRLTGGASHQLTVARAAMVMGDHGHGRPWAWKTMVHRGPWSLGDGAILLLPHRGCRVAYLLLWVTA